MSIFSSVLDKTLDFVEGGAHCLLVILFSSRVNSAVVVTSVSFQQMHTRHSTKPVRKKSGKMTTAKSLVLKTQSTRKIKRTQPLQNKTREGVKNQHGVPIMYSMLSETHYLCALSHLSLNNHPRMHCYACIRTKFKEIQKTAHSHRA